MPTLTREYTGLVNTVIDLEEQLHLMKNHHLGNTNHRTTEETLLFPTTHFSGQK